MTKIKSLTAHLKVRPFKTPAEPTFSAASEGVLHPLPDTATLIPLRHPLKQDLSRRRASKLQILDLGKNGGRGAVCVADPSHHLQFCAMLWAWEIRTHQSAKPKSRRRRNPKRPSKLHVSRCVGEALQVSRFGRRSCSSR